jgi:hypothetical protein
VSRYIIDWMSPTHRWARILPVSLSSNFRNVENQVDYAVVWVEIWHDMTAGFFLAHKPVGIIFLRESIHVLPPFLTSLNGWYVSYVVGPGFDGRPRGRLFSWGFLWLSLVSPDKWSSRGVLPNLTLIIFSFDV